MKVINVSIQKFPGKHDKRFLYGETNC